MAVFWLVLASISAWALFNNAMGLTVVFSWPDRPEARMMAVGAVHSAAVSIIATVLCVRELLEAL